MRPPSTHSYHLPRCCSDAFPVKVGGGGKDGAPNAQISMWGGRGHQKRSWVFGAPDTAMPLAHNMLVLAAAPSTPHYRHAKPRIWIYHVMAPVVVNALLVKNWHANDVGFRENVLPPQVTALTKKFISHTDGSSLQMFLMPHPDHPHHAKACTLVLSSITNTADFGIS